MQDKFTLLFVVIYTHYSHPIKHFITRHYNMELLVAQSLEEYISIVKEKKTKNKNAWFRGMSNSMYKLEPSLFREKRLIGLEFSGRLINNNYYRKSDAVIKSDLNAIEKFISYYKKLYPEKCKKFNLIDYLYIMQHYEIPTRLLDFSTNELIALYFSVASADSKSNSQADKEIKDFYDCYGNSDLGSSIHIIDPVITNYHTNKFINLNEDILNIDDIKLDILNQITLPICISTTNNDPRITNQNGVFMLFGSDYRAYNDYDIFCNTMTKIFIPNSCRLSIKEELKEKHKISHFFIYPDIKGISMEIVEEINIKYHSDCLKIFKK